MEQLLSVSEVRTGDRVLTDYGLQIVKRKSVVQNKVCIQFNSGLFHVRNDFEKLRVSR
jgi:hypothetical protein